MLALIASGGSAMSTITVRNIDDEIKAKLRVRAARNGRSMEAEVRDIIAAAVGGPTPPEKGLGTWLHEQLANVGYVDLELPPRDEPARWVEFDE
jgi:plasmid stability protein